MIKKKIACVAFLFMGTAYAVQIVDCNVHKGVDNTCNPYSAKLIRAKEVTYDNNSKKLIVSKTLPVPEKKVIKVISVPDMVERYVHVDESLRFKGNDSKIKKEALSSKKKKTKKVVKEVISKEAIQKEDKDTDTHTSEFFTKEEGIYKVVSGDVFSKIAQKFGFSTQSLLALNHLDKQSTLHIGQEIKIPLSQKMVDSIAHAEYTIEKGDTLLSIAHKFNLDPKLLVKFNHLKSSAMIREGKTLILPLPHIVKKIEAEQKIALAKKKKAEAKKRALAKKKALRISQRKLYVKNKKFGRHKLRVTATAYSSHRAQTDSTPFLAAWNNRLRPGMKIIAVSRDLITRYGLGNGTKVKISGLPGYYRVRDKMNKRFRRRIDIYMGINRRRALRWGRRSVVIYW